VGCQDERGEVQVARDSQLGARHDFDVRDDRRGVDVESDEILEGSVSWKRREKVNREGISWIDAGKITIEIFEDMWESKLWVRDPDSDLVLLSGGVAEVLCHPRLVIAEDPAMDNAVAIVRGIANADREVGETLRLLEGPNTRFERFSARYSADCQRLKKPPES
jgi:hypothetical protein